MPSHTHRFHAPWPFAEPEDTPVFASVRIVRRNLRALIVTHQYGGDWSFLCATTSEPMHQTLACFGCLVQSDPRLAELADLPNGMTAYRELASDMWTRVPADPDEV